MTDGNTQAENLLELELDRRLDFDDLVAKILSVTDGGWELAGWWDGYVIDGRAKKIAYTLTLG